MPLLSVALPQSPAGAQPAAQPEALYEAPDAGNEIAVVGPDLHAMIEVAPLDEEGAVAVEHLHAVVLAIADQDLAEAVDPHGVRRGELARPCAGLAPGGAPAAV